MPRRTVCESRQDQNYPAEPDIPSKKSRWDFSAETSALRARFVGAADKPHTCADRSVFCLGKAEAKKEFQ